MIDQYQVLVACNVAYVVLSIVFLLIMLRAASIYNWNPGNGPLQQTQKIRILVCITAITAIGLVAAVTNLLFV